MSLIFKEYPWTQNISYNKLFFWIIKNVSFCQNNYIIHFLWNTNMLEHCWTYYKCSLCHSMFMLVAHYSNSDHFLPNLISVSVGVSPWLSQPILHDTVSGNVTGCRWFIWQNEEAVCLTVIYVPHIAMEVLINKHLPPELLESRGKANFSTLTSSVQPHCRSETPHTLHHPTTHIHPPTLANKPEICRKKTELRAGLGSQC